MIPRTYTVGNFKAIGAPQSIQIRPITLLFGKNSAGKSSIIQSLLLCRHAAETGSFDFNSARHWGQSVDLGGFRNFVHRHDTASEMTFGFEFTRTDLEKTRPRMIHKLPGRFWLKRMRPLPASGRSAFSTGFPHSEFRWV